MEREKSKSFKDLIVWQKAHELVLGVYKETKTFPKEELFGLVSQVRRLGISVAASIVEGFKKKGKLDKLRFFNISQGSLSEIEYYLMLSMDLKYSNNNELVMKANEVGGLLEGYMKAFNSTSKF